MFATYAHVEIGKGYFRTQQLFIRKFSHQTIVHKPPYSTPILYLLLIYYYILLNITHLTSLLSTLKYNDSKHYIFKPEHYQTLKHRTPSQNRLAHPSNHPDHHSNQQVHPRNPLDNHSHYLTADRYLEHQHPEQHSNHIGHPSNHQKHHRNHPERHSNHL